MTPEAPDIRPLSLKNWDDYVLLMESSRTTRQCWCLGPLVAKESLVLEDEAKDKMKSLVSQGKALGLLFYMQKKPVGWLAYGRRSELSGFDYNEDGEAGDWVLPCFYFIPGFSSEENMAELIHAAIEEIRERGGQRVVAYPMPRDKEKKVSRSLRFGGRLDVFLNLDFQADDQISDSSVRVIYEIKDALVSTEKKRPEIRLVK